MSITGFFLFLKKNFLSFLFLIYAQMQTDAYNAVHQSNNLQNFNYGYDLDKKLNKPALNNSK